MEKACLVYKVKNNFKLLTMYKKESWAYMLSKPIYILSDDLELTELSNAIFTSLESSRKISEKEEDEFYDYDLLKELKEKSLMGLYKNSTSCIIYMDGEKLEIQPQVCIKPREGLVPAPEGSIYITYSKDKELDITKEIVKVL